MNRRWLRVSAVVSSAGVLLFLFVPWAMTHVIQQALLSAGARSAHIGGLALNPLAGKLIVRRLDVVSRAGRRIHVAELEARMAWSPLLRRRLVIEEVIVRGARLILSLDKDRESWRVSGFPMPLRALSASDGANNDWQLDLRRVSVGGVLTLQLPWYRGEVQLGELAVTQAMPGSEVNVDAILHVHGAHAHLAAKLDGSKLAGEIRLMRLPLPTLHALASPWLMPTVARMRGRLHAMRLPFRFDLERSKFEVLDGELEGRNLRLDLAEQVQVQADALHATIAYDGKAWHVRAGDARDWTLVQQHGVFLRGKALHIAALDGHEADWQAKKLRADQLSLELPDGGKAVLACRVDRVQLDTWNGMRKQRFKHAILASLKCKQGKQSLDVASVQLQSLDVASVWRVPWLQVAHVRWQQGADRAWRIERGMMQGLEYAEADGLRIERLQGSGMSMDGGKRAQRLGALELRSLQLKGSDLALRQAMLRGVQLNLMHDRAHGWSLDGSPLGAGGRAQTEGRLRLVHVDQVQLVDGTIGLEDRTIKPTYHGSYRLHRAQLRQLDRAHPDRPTSFTADVSVHGGRLQLRGHMRPFARPSIWHLHADVRAVSLPLLSPLLRAYLGYGVRTGQLDAKVGLKVVGQRVSGQAHFTLRQLDLASAGKRVLVGAEMSAETAIEILRDRNDDIEIDIPISGDIRHPDFNFQDAINQALANALQKAALGYIAQALQPYGALVTVADLAWSTGKKLLVVRLDPLRFPAGAHTLPASAWQGYLGQLAKLMHEKKHLRLMLCGKATKADAKALAQGDGKVDEQRLRALATARAQWARALLHDHFALDGARMFLCQPELLEDGTPRLEMILK